jgi:aminoglycoside 6'-N-acetyltransferase I
MRIIDLSLDDDRATEQAARLLVEGFAPHAWASMEEALEEVRASFGADRISRVALDEQNTVLGWVGGLSEYDGNVWEMHPLVVARRHQGQGVGRMLVADFEEQVKSRGGVTVMLGTDDEDHRTSLSGIHLFPNVWEHITSIRNLGRHPYEFYQKLGFVIVGVIPDANGPGKPDILMAKSVAT